MRFNIYKMDWRYVVFAILVKAFFFFYFQNLKCPNCSNDIFYVISGDANDYIQPVENFITYGEHRTNNNEYSLRMPGYTPVLLFFRLFLNLDWALNFTLFFQVILSGLSCYVLGLITFKLFKSEKGFLLTFIIYTFSTYVSIWDTYLLTESFASSALIFSFYFLIVANERQSNVYFLLSGLLMTWCFFLRPFMLLVLFLFASIIILHELKKRNLQIKLIFLTIFISPFILAEGCWVVRNYSLYNKLVFTQSRITYNDGDVLSKSLPLKLYIASFASSFGGDNVYWNSIGATHWFFDTNPNANNKLFPTQIFNDSLTIEHLLEVKKKCILLTSDSLDYNTKNLYESKIKEDLWLFFKLYKENHPFHYYVTSRILHLKNFIIHTGVYNIPFPSLQNQSLYHKIIKSFYALIYLCVFLIGGISGVILIVRNYSNPFIVLLALIPFYIILLFPVVFKTPEYRFSTLAYPFLVVTLSYVILITWKFTTKLLTPIKLD